MQDLLGLPNKNLEEGYAIRTNIPNEKGQWQWKMQPEQFSSDLQSWLQELVTLSQR
jgi:hypothetical protein